MTPEPGFSPYDGTPEPITYGDTRLRAIAIDIDGTITDMRRRLEWDAVAALRTAEARGIPVILATGNVIPATKTYAVSIGTSAPIVCENGGTVYWERRRADGKGSHVHHSVLHDRKAADEVVQTLRDEGHEIRTITSDPWRVSEAALEYTLDPEIVRAAAEAHPTGDLTVVATGFAIHILPRELDKYHGIGLACEWLNTFDPRFNPDIQGTVPEATPMPGAEPLDRDQILAIGDSPNDRLMMQRCGHGAAVANARPEIVEVAGMIAKRPHGAGVREILETLGIQVDAPRFS